MTQNNTAPFWDDIYRKSITQISYPSFGLLLCLFPFFSKHKYESHSSNGNLVCSQFERKTKMTKSKTINNGSVDPLDAASSFKIVRCVASLSLLCSHPFKNSCCLVLNQGRVASWRDSCLTTSDPLMIL